MEDTARELARQIGPLRRAVLRATRAQAGLPDLPDAQIEILRVLQDGGPCSPAELAARARLARSTVSNLTTAMTTAGLLDRARVEGAGRPVLLAPSAHAVELLRRYDDAAMAVVAASLAHLAPADAATLAAAVPLLADLVRSLTDESAQPSR